MPDNARQSDNPTTPTIRQCPTNPMHLGLSLEAGLPRAPTRRRAFERRAATTVADVCNASCEAPRQSDIPTQVTSGRA
eukprot:6131321-Prymnesium_polylepis.1